MPTVNALEEWYKNALSISSSLLIRPVVLREDVVFIYEALKKCFGSEFFNLIVGKEVSFDKSIWINQLLANKNHVGCIGALFQLSELIIYADSLGGNIKDEIKKNSKNPRNLRSFFYELFVFKILDLNSVENRKKIFVGNQEIEGICNIKGVEFLFECRKIFLPRTNDLDTFKQIMTFLYLKGKEMNKVAGMICGIKLNRPVQGNQKVAFKEKIEKFFKALNDSEGFSSIDYTDNDNAGVFRVFDYTPASLIEARELSNYDILFCAIPQGEVRGKIHLRLGIEGFFKVGHDAIYKKLESALKEKKNQHKNSIYDKKIVFIDSEVFPGLDMDIFHMDSSYDADSIRRLHNKIDAKNILCITRRIYTKAKPEILTDVFFPPELEAQAKYLQKMFNVNLVS
jgi:hypothetical protein